MMHLIGIDLGTSFIKGAVLDLESAQILHVMRRPFPEAAKGLPPLYHEVEPQAVVEATAALLRDLAAQAPECGAVLVSSQMHGFLLADNSAQSAGQSPPEALSRVITWQDQRALAVRSGKKGESAFAELQAQLTPAEILALGNGFKPSLPLCALYAMRQEQGWPEQAGTTPPVVWSLPDYVFARLDDSGAVESTAEPTMAASLGAYDFGRGDWHSEVLQRLGLGDLRWPRIVAFHQPVGRVDVGERRVPVYPAIGDHQCATLGSLLQPGELALNISTGSQVSTLAERWIPNAAYESRPYFGGRYLNSVTRVPAGRALTALMELLTEIPRRQGVPLRDAWQTAAEALDAIEETDLQVNLSFFASPFGESGAISQMHEANMTVGHLLLGAFANMAENYATCAEWLGRSALGQEQGLVFAGGLAQRFVRLRRLVAERLGASYRMSPSEEDALLGLLVMGLVVMGQAGDMDRAIAEVRKKVEQTQ